MTRPLRDAGVIGAASTGAAAALGATVASSCCAGPVIAPLMVGVLGAGGAAWAASLKPFSLYFLAASLLLLGYAFRSAYRSRRPLPSPGTCRVAPPRWLTVVLWSSAALWTVALGLNLFLAIR